MFPIAPKVHSDQRGDLMETVRSHGGTGQSFVSTTLPGQMRGDHYHLHKVERFFVLKGEAEISLRRLRHDDVVTFRMSGARPAFVDMPTLWVHNIRNVGEAELITVFWADQLLDPENPDQYPERVSVERGGAMTKVMTIVGTRPEIIRLATGDGPARRDLGPRARAHRTELRPPAEPGLLRRPRATCAGPLSRGGHVLARRGARGDPDQDRAGAAPGAAGRRAGARRHQLLHRLGDGEADARSRRTTWRRATAASTRTFPRRPIAGWSTTSPTSTSPTPSTPGATCSPRGCIPGG